MNIIAFTSSLFLNKLSVKLHGWSSWSASAPIFGYGIWAETIMSTEGVALRIALKILSGLSDKLIVQPNVANNFFVTDFTLYRNRDIY